METNAKIPLESSVSAVGGRSFYARVSALGFGLIALAGVVVLVLGLTSGNGGDSGGGAVFGLVFVAVGLLVAGLVWRFGRWALILAAVLALALLGLVGPFSLFSLGHPESARDFIPIMLALAGALLGLVGSVVAIVQWRRGTARASGTRTERLALGVTLGAVAGAVVLSTILTLVGNPAVSAEARASATSMVIRNFTYTPILMQVKSGETVRLVLKNDDPTLHTFTLPRAGVDVSVPPGGERIVEFKAPSSGEYQWYCIPHSDGSGGTRSGMVGILQTQ